MWKYYLHYRKVKPKARTFPFARKLTEKLYNKDKTPQLTKGGKQKTKTRNRKFEEITRDDMMYKVLSLNDLLPIDSMNYKTQKSKWGDLGEWIAEQHSFANKKINNALVEFRFYAETQAKSDNDNTIGASKLISDGIFVKSGMFIDDNYNHINPMLTSIHYDKDNPRMEIRITEFDKSVKNVYDKISIHLEEWGDNNEQS